MGGYGSMRMVMKRPAVFGSVYAMSSCCLTPTGPGARPGDRGGGASPLEAIATIEQATALQFGQRVSLAFAAAWAPNLPSPPGNERMHEILTSYGIEHGWET
jgi:hypothetical protein